MLISTTAKVRWSNCNIKYYTERGYKWTKNGDTFDCRIEDLPKKSNVFVTLRCDYCGKEYQLKYYRYLEQLNGVIKKNCCSACAKRKVEESNLAKYGVKSTLSIAEIHDQTAEAQRLSYDTVYDNFLKHGFLLVSDKYINWNQELEYICLKHKELGIQRTTYSTFRGSKYLCSECVLENTSGTNSAQWKGGITNIHRYLRDKVDCWVVDSFKATNFKCAVTGEGGVLHVHHLFPFYKILEQLFEETGLPIMSNIGDYTEEESKLLTENIIRLHYEYGLGMPLKVEIHRLFHKHYGINNNPEQFEEFCQRYYNGEFD